MAGYLLRVAPQCGQCVKGQDMMVPRAGQKETHPGFVAKDQRYDCGACITFHASEFGFPPLDPTDYEAWNLWFRVQSQQRPGPMGEPGGLDYGVLPAVFTLEGIPPHRQRWLFHQLATINDAVQVKRAADAEKRSNEAKGPRVDV